MGKKILEKIQGAFYALGIELIKCDSLYEFEYEHLLMFLSVDAKADSIAFLSGVVDSGFGNMNKHIFETALDVAVDFHKGYSGEWNDDVPYFASPEYSLKEVKSVTAEWLEKELKAFFDAYMFLEANIHILCDPDMFGLDQEEKNKAGLMTPEELEAMILKDFIAETGFINIDAQDIKRIQESSDFIDGNRKVCPAKDVKSNLQAALDELKSAHPDVTLSRLAVNLLFNQESELHMEDMAALQSVLGSLEDVEIIWGIGKNDDKKDGNISICVLAGYKNS